MLFRIMLAVIALPQRSVKSRALRFSKRACGVSLERDGFALVRHHNFGCVATHGGDEFVRGGIDDRKRAVVARDHGIELEESA